MAISLSGHVGGGLQKDLSGSQLCMATLRPFANVLIYLLAYSCVYSCLYLLIYFFSIFVED